MELAAARKEGFVPKRLEGNDEKHPTKKILSVIGIMTTFGRRKNRDAIRKAWMPTGTFFIGLFLFSGSLAVHKDFRVGLNLVFGF